MFGGYKAKIELNKKTKITLISLVFKVKMIDISKMNWKLSVCGLVVDILGSFIDFYHTVWYNIQVRGFRSDQF